VDNSKIIKELLEAKKMNIAAFEREIESGVGSIRAIIDKNQNISGKILSKILNRYPEIDANWLITGLGKMYKNEVNIIEMEIELEELRAENKVLRKYLQVQNPVSIAAEDEEKYNKKS
jgi:hypothetical protein